MNRIHIHGWNNQFVGLAGGLAPFRFTDSMISNFNNLWQLQDDFKEWLETSSASFAWGLRSSDIHPLFVSEKDELIALQQHRLQALKYSLLCQRSKEDIDEIYDTLLNARGHIEEGLPELDLQYLDTAHSFLRLRYLLSLGDEQILENQKSQMSWNEIIADGLVLTAGSPYRLLAMQYIWQTAFGLLLPPLASKVLGWIFGCLAFPIQTALEFKAMKNYLHDFFWDEGSDGQYSYVNFRALLKGLCSTQGIIFGSVLTVLCYQICDIYFRAPGGCSCPPSSYFLNMPFLQILLTTVITSSWGRLYWICITSAA